MPRTRIGWRPSSSLRWTQDLGPARSPSTAQRQEQGRSRRRDGFCILELTMVVPDLRSCFGSGPERKKQRKRVRDLRTTMPMEQVLGHYDKDTRACLLHFHILPICLHQVLKYNRKDGLLVCLYIYYILIRNSIYTSFYGYLCCLVVPVKCMSCVLLAD